MAQDYYTVLGVERNATADDIKQAYRALTRKYHPDVNKAPDAEERFKTINEACGVLSDPEKRGLYDTYGTTDPRVIANIEAQRGNIATGKLRPSPHVPPRYAPQSQAMDWTWLDDILRGGAQYQPPPAPPPRPAAPAQTPTPPKRVPETVDIPSNIAYLFRAISIVSNLPEDGLSYVVKEGNYLNYSVWRVTREGNNVKIEVSKSLSEEKPNLKITEREFEWIDIETLGYENPLRKLAQTTLRYYNQIILPNEFISETNKISPTTRLPGSVTRLKYQNLRNQLLTQVNTGDNIVCDHNEIIISPEYIGLLHLLTTHYRTFLTTESYPEPETYGMVFNTDFQSTTLGFGSKKLYYLSWYVRFNGSYITINSGDQMINLQNNYPAGSDPKSQSEIYLRTLQQVAMKIAQGKSISHQEKEILRIHAIDNRYQGFTRYNIEPLIINPAFMEVRVIDPIIQLNSHHLRPKGIVIISDVNEIKRGKSSPNTLQIDSKKTAIYEPQPLPSLNRETTETRSVPPQRNR